MALNGMVLAGIAVFARGLAPFSLAILTTMHTAIDTHTALLNTVTMCHDKRDG
jgi:hypothetical protein